MHLAHVGIAIFIVGVTLVRAYEEETDVRMEVGSTVTVGGYTFRFDGVTEQSGPNYVSQVGNVVVLKDGRGIVRMRPEKRVYRVRTMPMTEAAIYSGVLRDLYVSLGEPLEGGAWSVRVYYKPFVSWIWGGCLAMAFGGGLCLSDRRYRLALGGRVRSKTPVAIPGAAHQSGP
jgi:cytochrome c-type biogenesis protein CcmF